MAASRMSTLEEERYQSLDEVLASEQGTNVEAAQPVSLLSLVASLPTFLPGGLVLTAALMLDAHVAPHITDIALYQFGPTISAPLLPQTVDVNLLFALAWGVPGLIIVICCMAKRDFVLLHSSLVGILETGAYVELLTTVLKKLAGALRPNFKNLCQWKESVARCTAPDYIIANARQSFPSGHTSNMAAGMCFLAIFLHMALCSRGGGGRWAGPTATGLLRVLCCVPPFCLYAWVAMSRVWDHYHRFEDVLAGSVLGTLVAFALFSVHVGGAEKGRDRARRPSGGGGGGRSYALDKV